MVLFWKKSDQPNKMVTASVALHAKEMEGHQGRSGVFHLGGSKVIREARWGLGRLRTGNSPTRIGISPIKIGISPIKIGISPIKIGISPIKIGISPTRIGISPIKIGISPIKIGISPIKIGISPIKIGISPIKIGISPTIWPKWCASDRLDLDHLAGRNCKPRLLLDNSEDHRALVLEPQKTAICKGNPLSNIFLGVSWSWGGQAPIQPYMTYDSPMHSLMSPNSFRVYGIRHKLPYTTGQCCSYTRSGLVLQISGKP